MAISNESLDFDQIRGQLAGPHFKYARDRLNMLKSKGVGSAELTAIGKDMIEAGNEAAAQENNWKAIDELERRRELCSFRYLNAHKSELPVSKSEPRRKIIDVFYEADEPEALLSMPVRELIAIYDRQEGCGA